MFQQLLPEAAHAGMVASDADHGALAGVLPTPQRRDAHATWGRSAPSMLHRRGAADATISADRLATKAAAATHKACNGRWGFIVYPLNVSFRWALMGNKLSQWHDLVARLLHINLGEESGKFVWQLNKNRSFSVQSMYNHLVNNGVKVTQEIWRMKLPLKIKIFLWFLKKRSYTHKG